MLIDKHIKYSINDDEREEQDDPHAMRQTSEMREAIEKSISDNLEFEYFVGPWSSCSQTCGLNDSGYRVSNSFFLIVNHLTFLYILAPYCSLYGESKKHYEKCR